jgi:hypothetical protein
VNLTPLLLENATLPERPYFFYRGPQLFACRIGPWKAHFVTQGGYGSQAKKPHEPPLLYHLGDDPAESKDVAAQHPEVLKKIQQAVQKHQSQMVPGVKQLKSNE